MGVFWDWPSLLQGDPIKAKIANDAALQEGKTQKSTEEAAEEAKRIPAEKAAFKHALQETMDLWYAHQATTVLLLTPGHHRPHADTASPRMRQHARVRVRPVGLDYVRALFRGADQEWLAPGCALGRSGRSRAGGGIREGWDGPAGRPRPV
ncbi:unnamed protein product [Prorocentrum cordatum]|uniref:FACT complex subunit n=1 Tax=Prorocentrum cordatum TaxID=2364126 RepID=A0ABN9QTM1_9DINO|nr:unnamed protein product [Polarella glacialis]